MITCPNKQCKEKLEWVRVYSEAWQRGVLEKNKIVDYGSVEELTDTIAIECPFCGQDVRDLVEE